MAKHIPLKHLTRIMRDSRAADPVQDIRDRLNGPAAHRRIPESRWETFVCAACVAMVAFLLASTL